jgi:hypothetical protein
LHQLPVTSTSTPGFVTFKNIMIKADGIILSLIEWKLWKVDIIYCKVYDVKKKRGLGKDVFSLYKCIFNK